MAMLATTTPNLKPVGQVIGVDPYETTTSKKFALGATVECENGAVIEYVLANTAVTGVGYVCIIDASNGVDMVSTSNDGNANQRIGVALGAIAAASYGWVLVHGRAPDGIRVLASCAANVIINTTSTAGALDDDATTGSYKIAGISLTTARGGSAGVAVGVLNWPTMGAVI